MKSDAKDVAAYLSELPEDRRKALSKLRALIRKDRKLVEAMQHGMACYASGDLLFALASQKQYMALYVCDTDVVAKHRAALGALDCGKSCIRFQNVEDLPLDVITRMLDEAYERRRG